jgi:hypothetical protein
MEKQQILYISVRKRACIRVRACLCACARVALIIQHAMRTRRITMSCGLSGSTTFSTLSHKRHDFRKNVTEYKICVLIFSTILFETFPILRINQRDIVINVKSLHVKYPLFLPDFN